MMVVVPADAALLRWTRKSVGELPVREVKLPTKKERPTNLLRRKLVGRAAKAAEVEAVPTKKAVVTNINTINISL